MMLIKKVLVAGVLTAALLSLASGTALTRTLSFRNSVGGRSWVATWIEFGFTAEGRCSLTLEGSLHTNSIAKTSLGLIGYVTRGSAGGCGILTGSVLTANLPWHVRYQSFSSPLPNIGSIAMQIIGFEFQVREGFGLTCLFRSSAEHPLVMEWNRAVPGSIINARLRGTLSSTNCFEAEFSATPASFGPSATITLI
jgi:hypothetical protein